MEILQTIWTALTTKNEILVLLLSIPLAFLEVTLFMLIFLTILKIENTFRQKVIYVFTLSTISIFTNLFVISPYNTYINMIILPLLVIIIFRTNFFEGILAEIIPYISYVIAGLIVSNVYIVIFKISNQDFNTIPIHKLTGSLLIYLFVFSIYKLIKNLSVNIMLHNNISKKKSAILFFNIILGILAICFESYIATIYTDYMPTYINLSSIIILFLYFSINMYCLFSTIKLEKTTQDLEQEKLYNKTITILYDNIRGFKHDFNNIVQAIGGYITSDNIDGLKEYYNGLLNDCQKSNELSLLNPEFINNPVIYSLLTSKYHKCEELNIKMQINALLDLSNINIKPYELSRILGILLDNSIEASNDSSEKLISVCFRKDSKVNRDLIIIENSYSNKNVNTNKIFEKGYTSKTSDIKSHGLGLWEVRQILNKNNNLNLHTTKTEEFFTQQLEIY